MLLVIRLLALRDPVGALLGALDGVVHLLLQVVGFRRVEALFD